MGNLKITPKARREILARVRAGEKQVKLAKEFSVSKGYISQIVRQGVPGESQESRPETDFKDTTPETLSNRYNECMRELIACEKEKDERHRASLGLEDRIAEESKRLQRIEDTALKKAVESTIMGLRQQLSYSEDHSRVDLKVIQLYEELHKIGQALRARGKPLPRRSSIYVL